LTAASCAVEPSRPPAADAAGTAADAGLPVARLDELYLTHPVQDAVEAVREVRESLQPGAQDLPAARVALERASGALAELTDFYLPLTSARDDLVGAYLNHRRGQDVRRDADLAAASIQLSWVVEHAPAGERESSTQLLSLLNALDDLDRASTQFTSQLGVLCQEIQNRLENAPRTVFRPGDGEAQAAGTTASSG
jgi:hypothetical protein